jgi:hypothetical protein
MNEPNPAARSLGPICCVTVTAPDLDQVEWCYTHYLGHRVVGRGLLGIDLAELWGCAGLAGNRYLLLSPAAGDECIFRFIETHHDADFLPFSTHGWNAAEIMVRNVDAMAERLAGSPFKIIGAPADLSFTDNIRAMQILGPGHELLYLTEFKRQIPEFNTPIARCDVDLVFIVILGGPSMDNLQNFYAKQYGVSRTPVVESRVKGMSAAFGNSPEHKYPISALPLAGKSLIEVDEMPVQARARPVAEGLLPAGIAMVSFAGSGLDKDAAIRIDRDEPPYSRSAAVTCCKGAAGEVIEILHTTG